MCRIIWISFLVLATKNLCIFAKAPDSLRMIHYLFRHGDRSPVDQYKGDPNPFSETWPKGAGQLTTIGMRQHYQLGRYFRQRYDGFLSELYSNREVHVRSTDVDRTLMSAYCHLAGLYPPYGEDVWNTELSWQPIPVHTIPQDLDFVLECDKCPRKGRLRNQVYELPYFKQITEEYANFMRWVSEQVGTHYDLTNIFEVAGPLHIENSKGLDLPKWVNTSVLHKLEFLRTNGMKTTAYTEQLQRVQGGAGPLVQDLIKRLESKISGKLDPNLKLYIYSAHDVTITAFLESIKSFNDIIPPYTATVIIELHEIDQEHFLQFSYKNDSTREPYDIIIPGCSLLCPFDKFVELTKPIISTDVQKECNQMDSGEYESTMDTRPRGVAVFIGGTTMGIIVVLLVLFLLFEMGNRRNKDATKYERLGHYETI